MAKSLLVTGAAGFIGANFVHYWLRENPEDRVLAYDALTYAGNLENLKSLEGDERFTFVKGDIRDESLPALSLNMCHKWDYKSWLKENGQASSLVPPPINRRKTNHYRK